MANQVTENFIPLAGRGHTYRRNGGYANGEYKQLVNIELNDLGYLVSRRNIMLCGKDAVNPAAVAPLSSPRRIIGYLGDGAVVSCNSSQTLQYGDPSKAPVTLWSPSAVLGTDQYSVLKHFVRYNKANYWITQYADSTYFGFKVYRTNAVTEDSTGATATPTLVATVRETGTTTSYADVAFKTAFVHKERLWIVAGGALYFSGATDFTNFTVPSGGFFKFNQAEINYAVTLRDSIYVICDAAIYIITYNADPNLDAQVIKIDDAKGGDSATVFNGAVYYSKDDTLNVINNYNVTKVMDLNLGLWGVAGNYTKLVSFGDYLVLLRHTYRSYYGSDGSIPTSDPNGFYDANKHPYSLSKTTGKPSMYMINMQQGSIHALDFKDNMPGSSPGYVSDMFLVPREDKNNNMYLYMLTKYDTGAVSTSGGCYVMPVSKPDSRYDGSGQGYVPASDYVTTSSNTLLRVNHHVRIEIDSFVPDGNEYKMKKFRTLVMSAKFPYGASSEAQNKFILKTAFDNRTSNTDPDGSSYNVVSELKDAYLSGAADARFPGPHRYPINQRARSLSLLLELKPDYTVTNSIFQDILIEDIRLFWTYTARFPTLRQQDAYADTM